MAEVIQLPTKHLLLEAIKVSSMTIYLNKGLDIPILRKVYTLIL